MFNLVALFYSLTMFIHVKTVTEFTLWEGKRKFTQLRLYIAIGMAKDGLEPATAGQNALHLQPAVGTGQAVLGGS